MGSGLNQTRLLPLLSHSKIQEILAGWSQGKCPSPQDQATLKTWELQDPLRFVALGIEPHKIDTILEQRSQLFFTVVSDFQAFCSASLRSPQPLWDVLWYVWLPLAMHIAARRQTLNHCMVQGILGSQGTGKTTLTHLLKILLKPLGYQAVSLSLDDLYKTWRDRQDLQQIDPRLIWRGPPGTHDIELGLITITALKTASPDQAIAIPRFDKALHQGAGDRIEPEWVSNVDILLFEGWFVGARPRSSQGMVQLPDPIHSQADRQFAMDMNQGLQAYLPLWETLDALLVLYPEDYRLSKIWRKQAEQQLRSRGQGGMSDAQIDCFVDYFWKALHPDLFVRPLIEEAGSADLAIAIQANHYPVRIFSPQPLSR